LCSVATKAKRPLTNSERQARYREKHLENIEGDKERAQFTFEMGTKRRLERIACHYGYPSATALIEQWAAQVASDVAEREEQEAKNRIIARYEHNA
jgi:hypothetical protein